ncbi:hypothetical protein N9343_01405 [Flavobacteriaceae bacterium]|nr:hypothetical protein [Flavobacteriaceae bacterium]
MNKFLILIFASFLFGCNGSVNDCGEVHTKYIEDAEYFLVINLSNQRSYDNGDNDSPGGEILADAKVSKTVYDSKRIGDEFCFEN